MATQRDDFFAAPEHGGFGRKASRAGLRGTIKALVVSALALGSAASLIPVASADPVANLRSQVDAARGKCAALQWDPILTQVATRANTETAAFAVHNARFIPFEDPVPVLQELGYPAGKARLLPGYGADAATAIHGVIVFGWEAIPDCTYTRYGLAVSDDPGLKFALAALVLAGD